MPHSRSGDFHHRVGGLTPVHEDSASSRRANPGEAWARLVTEAARQRSIPTQRIESQTPLMELGAGAYRRRVMHMIQPNTSAIGVTIARERHFALQLLAQAALPVQQRVLAATSNEAISAAETIGYPVQFRAKNSQREPLDAHVALSGAELRSGLAGAVEGHPNSPVVVENLVIGLGYSCLVIDFELVAALLVRGVNFIVGDGSRTLRELIMNATHDGVHMESFSRVSSIERLLSRTLAAVDFSLDDVVPDGAWMPLPPVSFLPDSGLPVDITDLVHADNRAIVQHATQIIDLDIAVVDVVTTDISRSMWADVGRITAIDVPMGADRMMLSPTSTAETVAGRLVESLFPPGTRYRPPVIAIANGNGADLVAHLIAHILQCAGQTVGLSTGDGLFVDGTRLLGSFKRRDLGVQPLLDNLLVESVIALVDPDAFAAGDATVDGCDITVLTQLFDHMAANSQVIETYLSQPQVPGGAVILNASSVDLLKMVGLSDRSVTVIGDEEDTDRLTSYVDAGYSAVFIDGDITSPNIFVRNRESTIRIISLDQVPPGLRLAGHSNDSADVLAAIAASLALHVDHETIAGALASFLGPR